MAITSPHTIRQLCPELHAAVIITRRPEAERKSLPSLEGWDIGFSMFLSAESRTFTKKKTCRVAPAVQLLQQGLLNHPTPNLCDSTYTACWKAYHARRQHIRQGRWG